MALASSSSPNSLLASSSQPPSLLKLSSSPSRQVWQMKGGLFIEDSSRASASWCMHRRVKPCIVAASSKDGDETKEDASEVPSTAAKPAISERRAQAEAEVKKGQTTAIVTGAISVLLGVGYLVLIQLLDTRGVILVPPPPEAFNP